MRRGSAARRARSAWDPPHLDPRRARRPRARAGPPGRRARAPAGAAGGARLAWDRRRRPVARARAGGDPHPARRPGAAATSRPVRRSGERKGQPWPRARAARCAGLLAADDELDARFGEALSFTNGRRTSSSGREPNWPTAPACAGRGGASAPARSCAPRSRSSSASARAPWIEQATAELAATGETARRRDVSTLDQLTPQELQVALLLSRATPRAPPPPSCS